MTIRDQNCRLIIEIDGDGQIIVERLSYQERGESPPSTWTSPLPPTWAQIVVNYIAYPIMTSSPVNWNLSYRAELLIASPAERASWPGSNISIEIELGLVSVTLSKEGLSTTLASGMRPTVERGEHIPDRFSITGVLQQPHVVTGT